MNSYRILRCNIFKFIPFLLILTVMIIYMVPDNISKIPVSILLVSNKDKFTKEDNYTVPRPEISDIVSNTIRGSQEIPILKDEKEIFTKNSKDILIYTDGIWYNSKRWNGQFDLKKMKCPATNCYFTTEKKNRSKADAVLFKFMNHPKSRPPGSRSQLYICADVEAAGSFSTPSKYCNLTLSHHSKSDIPSGYYGFFLPLEYKVRPMFPHYIDISSDTYVNYLEAYRSNASLNSLLPNEQVQYLINRPKNIAWMSSRCSTSSKREVFARKLSALFPVDMYGKCGTMECYRKNPLASQCWTNVMEKYYFYLTMENTLCEEYISEKLYNPLKYGLIPVVYGGANYEKVLPPYSYIDAKALGVRKLAELLKELMEDPFKRERYHLWRGFWSVNIGGSLCELCVALNTPKYSNKTANHYRWDKKKTTCFSPPSSFDEPWILE